jgi:protein phosphatase PTC7
MLKSSVRCVSKKYDFNKMNDDISDIYKTSKYGGEDAWFINDNTIGVADGANGVSSAFSNSLMLECEKYSKHSDEPIKILEAAYIATKNNVIGGSSTACIAKLNQLQLNCANHGDSGLIIVRDNEIIYETKNDLMDEDLPFQLGKWELNEDEIKLDEHKRQTNLLYNQYGRRIIDTQTYIFDVKINDIIITATDGFFDNITDSLIVDSCKSNDPDSIAIMLMKRAISGTVSKNDPDYIDDITIIVSIVVNIDDH